MDFFKLQQEVSGLLDSGESSLAAYLSLAKKVEAITRPPAYVRPVKVAFLSNFTIQGLPEVFKAQAVFHNLLVSTYLGPYNQYAQEILDQESELYKFKPRLGFLIVDSSSADKDEIAGLAKTLQERSGAMVIAGGPGLKGEFKFDEFLESIGREKYWNTKYKELGDLRLAPTAFPLLSNALMGYAVAAAGATKKCLVLDLDNTLWRGIVGEDGAEGVKPNRELQEYLLKLYERGVILAINSRNNEADAFEVFKSRPDMVLKRDHFAACRINWQDKVQNMHELAEELNLGLDSFVFVDDDPFQSTLVKEALPAVMVVPLQYLTDYPGFTTLGVTVEDTRRGQMYAEERRRQDLKSRAKSVEEFLQGLQLESTIRPVNKQSIPRVSQLTQKTNQFNLTTRRYSEADIRRFLKVGWKMWTIEAKDRFGDYGIVGVQMVEPAGNDWRVDNFLISCRILGRGIERALLTFVLNEADAAGAKRIIGEFIPTAKNKPAEAFYPSSGFRLVSENESGRWYEYQLAEHPLDYPSFIKVTTQA